jgi:hypothetical protein
MIFTTDSELIHPTLRYRTTKCNISELVVVELVQPSGLEQPLVSQIPADC